MKLRQGELDHQVTVREVLLHFEQSAVEAEQRITDLVRYVKGGAEEDIVQLQNGVREVLASELDSVVAHMIR